MMNQHRRLLLILFCCLQVAVAAFGPAPLQADLQQAKTFQDASCWKEAVAAYRAVLPTLSGEARVEAHLNIAYSLSRWKKRDEALKEYHKVLAHPAATPQQQARAYDGMGYLLYITGEFEGAHEAYKKIVESAGSTPDLVAVAWLRRASIMRKQEKPEEARQAYLNAVAVADANPVYIADGYLALGDMLQEAGNYQQAAEIYRRAKAVPHAERSRRAANRLEEVEAALDVGDEYFIGPYVSHVTASTARVYWISRAGVRAGRVMAWPQGEAGGPIEATAEITAIKGRTELRQLAELRSLKPGTEYSYAVTTGGEKRTGHFQTAPVAPAVIRFAVYGDTQGGHQAHSKVAGNIARDNPGLVLHVGDCVEQGNRWDEWKIQMFDPALPFLRRAPIYPARGNHDGGHFFSTFFAPGERDFYSVRYGDALFVVLDSMQSTSGRLRAEQLLFLERTLRENADAKWKFVSLHHLLISGLATEPLFGEEDFVPVMMKYGVDMTFNGHYHIYQRLLPVGLPGKKPLVAITTGGGGGNYDKEGITTTLSPLVAKAWPGYHHCFAVIDGDTLQFEVKDSEGSVLDQMALRHTPQGFQPEVMTKMVDYPTAQQIKYVYEDLSVPRKLRLLQADFTPQPGVGEPVRVKLHPSVLHTDKLPRNAELVVTSVPGSSWQVARQVLKVADNQFTFEAIPAIRTGRVLSPLQVVLTLKLGQRLYEPQEFTVASR